MYCAPGFIALLSSFIIFWLMAPPVQNVKHVIRDRSTGRGESCILEEIVYAESDPC